ncbi:unnamed protein product [Staurois parvus]|uniref:Uncharacterized protein n=1 Tax=Staurois parvus TaxID=386267 RepID=A0ABN9ADC9_9NEOB|nr:unnamed protein product [Staurois parvus]
MWAPGCDSLRLHSQVPTEHVREALRFVNGPVVFWDLSRVPEDYRGGGGQRPFPIAVEVGAELGAGTCQIRVPAPQRCQSLMGIRP